VRAHAKASTAEQRLRDAAALLAQGAYNGNQRCVILHRRHAASVAARYEHNKYE
jgi:hypothetical protein